MAFINEVNDLLNSSEGLKVRTEDGKIVEAKEGVVGEIVTVDNKKEINKLVWGRERAGIREIQELEKTVQEIIKYVAANASAATKKSIRDNYPSYFEAKKKK
jgi:hypothetical protein